MRKRSVRYSLARAGDLPAEALSTRDRERLIGDLDNLGWTIAEIAEHTDMTTYTTARIRDRMKRAHRAREVSA